MRKENKDGVKLSEVKLTMGKPKNTSIIKTGVRTRVEQSTSVMHV
jgi:hypothetical protein